MIGLVPVACFVAGLIAGWGLNRLWVFVRVPSIQRFSKLKGNEAIRKFTQELLEQHDIKIEICLACGKLVVNGIHRCEAKTVGF